MIIGIVTVFDAILMSRQTREKLQCLHENHENLMSNNFHKMVASQAGIFREELRAPLKAPAWEASKMASSETQGQLEGGGKKSKRARKNIRAKKSQERGEDPLGTRF